MEILMLALITLAFGLNMFYLAFKCYLLKCKIDTIIDVRDIVYCFKIMEIKPYDKSYILKGIDSIQIKLNGNDFIRHAPVVGEIFVMQRSGEITILPGSLISE